VSKFEVVEHNPLSKRWKKGDVKVGLVYPNEYKSGIANIGLQQIYAEVNSLDNYVCERFYWDVFGCKRSVETGTRIEDFDVLLFSIQFEEDYFRVVKLLKNNIKSVKIAGGPCVMENPLPLTPYFDYFYIGEIDNDVERLLNVVLSNNEENVILKSNTILELSESEEVVKVRKAKLDTHLKEELIGEGVYGKCFLLEVGRGCFRSCSFCVVRQIYKPCRWRDLKLLLDVAENCQKICKKIALISPSVTDYPKAKDLIWELVNMGFEVSPSSMRIDTIDDELAELLFMSGQKSITVAPEAGSEKLRKILRKGIGDDDIFNALDLIHNKINNVKLYFMIGIPKENMDDLKCIVNLVENVKKMGFKVSVSINPLVPKPHTPLQFAPFSGESDNVKKVIKNLKKKSKYLELELKKRCIKVNIENPENFAIQTILSRGDKLVGEKMVEGKKNLIKSFSYLLDELNFERKYWEFIDHGYNFKKLRKEYISLFK